MSRLSVFVLLAVVAVVWASPQTHNKYTSKWDNINIEAILKNDRLVDKYVQCLLEEKDKNCTADAIELKRYLPEAMATDCARCTHRQKINTEKVMRYMLKNRADVYKKIEAKYDPAGNFRRKYTE